MSTNANNFAPNIALPKALQGELAAGTHRARVKVGGSSDVYLQWVDNVGDGVASFTIYASAWSDTEREVKDLDPAINKHWHDETAKGAVFDASPSGTPGTGTLTMTSNPGIYFLLIEIVVTMPFTQFEFGVRTQNRNG